MTDVFDEIESDVRRLIRRRRTFRAVNLLGVALALAGLWVLLAATLDRFFRFPRGIRCGMLAVGGLIALAGCVRAIHLLVRSVDPVEAGAFIERRRPDVRGQLVTVLTQRRLTVGLRASAALLEVVAADVIWSFQRVAPKNLVTLAAIRPAGILCGGTLAVALGLSAAIGSGFPRLIARQLLPWAPIRAVSRTTIEVPDGTRDLLPGHAVSIVADITPEPAAATLWVGRDESNLRPIEMIRTFRGRFSLTLPPLRNPLVYRIRAGDTQSQVYALRLIRPLTVNRLDVQVQVPDGRTQALNESDGTFAVVRGAHVRAEITASDPLVDATVTFSGLNVLTEPTRSPNVRTAEFFVTRSGPWSISLTGTNGIAGSGRPDMRLSALPENLSLNQDVVSKIPGDYEGATSNYLRAISTTQPKLEGVTP